MAGFRRGQGFGIGPCTKATLMLARRGGASIARSCLTQDRVREKAGRSLLAQSEL